MIDLDFGAGGHLYATHQMHAFAARCPAPVARWAIDTYSGPGDVVLDPMVGSGTTLVEARLCGRQAWGCDIDPLARLIAKVKATDVDLDALDRAIANLEERLRRSALDDTWRPDLVDVGRWFRPQVAKDLARIRDALLSSRAPRPVRDLCWVAFSSVITARTSVANARDLVHSRHHYRRWTKDPRTRERFFRRLRQMRAMLANFTERVAQAPQRTEVRMGAGDASWEVAMGEDAATSSAVEHFSRLDSAKRLGRNYIAWAPPEVDTPLRRALRDEHLLDGADPRPIDVSAVWEG